MKHLKKVVTALGMASPFVLIGHYGALTHCVEASTYGVAALKRFNVQARPLFCSAIGYNYKTQVAVSMGIKPHDLYKLCEKSDDTPSFDEWALASLNEAPECPVHAVIEARLAGERALVDLTAGQMQPRLGWALPMHLIWYGDGWPHFENDSGYVQYMACPHATEIRGAWREYKAPKVVVDDVHELMKVAIRCDLDVDRFYETIQRAQPALFEDVSRRLTSLMAAV